MERGAWSVEAGGGEAGDGAPRRQEREDGGNGARCPTIPSTDGSENRSHPWIVTDLMGDRFRFAQNDRLGRLWVL